MTGRKIAIGLTCAAWLGMCTGPAHAATATGTILTNTASMYVITPPTTIPPLTRYDVSYSATATVEVIPPPQLLVTKRVTADGTYLDRFVAGAGAVVTFRICARNDTVTVANGVVLTDIMPAGMTFESAPVDWTGDNYYTGTAPTLAIASGTPPPPPTAAAWPTTGTAGPQVLRWTVSAIDSFKSVCVTFQARIQ